MPPTKKKTAAKRKTAASESTELTRIDPTNPKQLVVTEAMNLSMTVQDVIDRYIVGKDFDGNPIAATPAEVALFFDQCVAHGLDPRKREIYFVKYDARKPGQNVTGYQVYISRAEEAGLLEHWAVEVEPSKFFTFNGNPDYMARVKIWKKGQDPNKDTPFIWEAEAGEWSTGKALWKTKRLFMTKKVAIGQAFRLCFERLLGGLPYTPEEIIGETSKEPVNITDQVKVENDTPEQTAAPKAEPEPQPDPEPPAQEPEVVEEPPAQDPEEETTDQTQDNEPGPTFPGREDLDELITDDTRNKIIGAFAEHGVVQSCLEKVCGCEIRYINMGMLYFLRYQFRELCEKNVDPRSFAALSYQELELGEIEAIENVLSQE